MLQIKNNRFVGICLKIGQRFTVWFTKRTSA